MKKVVPALLLLVYVCAAVSCKKETTGTGNTSAVSGTISSNLATYITNFGVLPHDVSGDDKVTVAQELGVGYVRDAIMLDKYNGKAPVVDNYLSNGFKVLLNLNYTGGKKPSPFPTDMVKYQSLLQNVVTKYKPEVAVIENEPANDGNYSGPIDNYFTELRTAITVCHAQGIKVSDGALHTGMVCILVYQDYVNRGLQQKADDFANRGLSSTYLRAAQGKGSADINAKLVKCQQMITAYSTMDLDFVNMHWYEPLNTTNDPSLSAPGVAKEVAAYLRRTTGKQILTNEFGQTNQIPSLVISQVNEFRLAGLAYAIDFSGTSGGGIGAQTLNIGTTLLPNGIAYRDAVAK